MRTQIAANGATDAAVIHLEHFLVGADDQIVVDADLAEFIDNDRVFFAVRLGENAIEQRCLAGTKVAGEYGDRILPAENGSDIRSLLLRLYR